MESNCKKSIAKLVKGMEVEILKSGTTAKPNQKEIAAAFEKKYNIEVHYSNCSTSSFDIKEVK
ncbi:hypothetical protein [Flavobacterium sp.]|uniref:hypothetical protein n=1 Tax=Flavobacterium sp. TaxID=239 RepID=UPI004048B295